MYQYRRAHDRGEREPSRDERKLRLCSRMLAAAVNPTTHTKY